jgi:hypothetical protein
MGNGEDVYAAGRWVAIAADEYAKAVTEAVRLRRCEVVRLVDAMRSAETLADAARIETELTTVQEQYEAALMTETIALQAHNDQLGAELRSLLERHRP